QRDPSETPVSLTLPPKCAQRKPDQAGWSSCRLDEQSWHCGKPRSSTLSSPEVIHSEAWAVAVEKGRWPDAVRPFTSNRQHLLREIIAQASAPV
ncbi:MAG: hypothetical protein ACO3V7_12930, partial [Burkholderiaceae bacterium]